MNHRTILTAIEKDLNSNGYDATYLGPCTTLPDLYRVAVNLRPTPEKYIHLCCWKHCPHLILMAGPDWKVDLTEPNSIEQLYQEVRKRLCQATAQPNTPSVKG